MGQSACKSGKTARFQRIWLKLSTLRFLGLQIANLKSIFENRNGGSTMANEIFENVLEFNETGHLTVFGITDYESEVNFQKYKICPIWPIFLKNF